MSRSSGEWERLLPELRRLLNYNNRTGVFTWKVIRQARYGRIGEEAGWIDRHGYRRIGVCGGRIAASRLAWLFVTGTMPTFEIDHKNRNRAVNRWRNLRPATRLLNAWNVKMHRDNASGIKGIYLDKGTGRWRARIMKDGETHHLGRFDTPEAAGRAYRKAAKRLFGEYAAMM